MVVLHHFSNPPWINRMGAWVNPATVPAFVDFAAKLAAALRHRVRLWNTFNEPDTYAGLGYLIGEFPPLKKFRMDSFRAVVRHMALAHEQICPILRQTGSELGPVEVGFSKNWTFCEAYQKKSLWDLAAAALYRSQLNEFVLDSFLGGSRKEHSTFLGINYYGRVRLRNLQPLVPPCGFDCEELARLGVECDDMFERHPAGLESALRLVYRQTKLPIYLTEHGSASSDEAFRERDLKDNLAALHRAIQSGVPVRGFFYWSLLDNFEWQFGYTKKFGLIRVNFDDERLPRKMKPLGEIYRRICRENGFRLEECCVK